MCVCVCECLCQQLRHAAGFVHIVLVLRLAVRGCKFVGVRGSCSWRLACLLAARLLLLPLPPPPPPPPPQLTGLRLALRDSSLVPPR